jgi:general stress protein 26
VLKEGATMDVGSFDEIRADFMARISRIVWCTVATVDRAGRPRTRILHPIWEDTTGWIATGRHSHKEKHLAGNPYVSLSYWDSQHEMVYAECKAEWVDDAAQKERIWELFKSTPPPLGYDPAIIWADGPTNEDYGLLKLTASRIELYALMDMMQGKGTRVWRASE